MAENKKTLFRRRLSDAMALANNEEEMQRVTYEFLLELDSLAEKQEITEKELERLRTEFEQGRKRLERKMLEMQDASDTKLTELITLLQPVIKLVGMSEKIKNGLLLILLAYLFKDSPEGLAVVKGWLGLG